MIQVPFGPSKIEKVNILLISKYHHTMKQGGVLCLYSREVRLVVLGQQ